MHHWLGKNNQAAKMLVDMMGTGDVLASRAPIVNPRMRSLNVKYGGSGIVLGTIQFNSLIEDNNLHIVLQMQQDVAKLMDKHAGKTDLADLTHPEDVVISNQADFSNIFTSKVLYSDVVDNFDQLRDCKTIFVTVRDAREEVEAALRRRLPYHTYDNTVLTVFGSNSAHRLNEYNQNDQMALPAIVAKLRDMTKLVVHQSANIVSLPNSLHMLAYLTSLTVEFQPIEYIDWKTLPHLKELELLYTHITALPQFEYLPELQVLNIGGSEFERQPFPPTLCKCVNLTSVSLINCNLAGLLPDDILKLTKLKELNLEQNDIDWPNMPALETLPRLNKISVSHLDMDSAWDKQIYHTFTRKGYEWSSNYDSDVFKR